MRKFFFLLILLPALITGCSASPFARSEQKAEIPHPLQVDSQRDSVQAQALLVVNDGQILHASPVNPFDLTKLPGGVNLDFGHHYTYAASPDDKQLAMVIWPSGEYNRNGSLHMIDTETWKKTEVEGVTINDHVSKLFFSPDGKNIYWTEPLSLSLPLTFQLSRYDLQEKRKTKVAELPAGLVPFQMRLLSNGKRVVVYGGPDTPDQNASLTFVDLETGRLHKILSLDGVMAGSVQAGTANEPTFHFLRPGLAWDMKREKLYIVHADEEKVTVVDLTAEKVEKQAEIMGKQSFAQQISQWLLPTAEAKMAVGTERQTALSADGQFLYITGMRNDLKKETDGRQKYSEIPLGLRVISTTDFHEENSLPLPVSQLALSPDGKHLVMTGSALEVEEVGGNMERERRGSGIYLFDARTMEQKAHVEKGKTFYLRGFTSGGEHVGVSSLTSAEGKEELLIINLKTGKITGRQEADQWFIDLLPLQQLNE